MQRVGAVVELGKNEAPQGAVPAKPNIASHVDRYRTPRTVQGRREAVSLARVCPLPGRTSIGQKSRQLYVATQDVRSLRNR